MELISDAIRGKRKLHVVLVRSAMKTSIANNSNKKFPVAWLEFKCIFESPNRIPFTWKHCRTHFRHKVTVATTQSIQSIRFNYKFRFEINLPGTDDVDCNPCQRFTCHRQFHFEFSLLVIASTNSYTTRVKVEKKTANPWHGLGASLVKLVWHVNFHIARVRARDRIRTPAKTKRPYHYNAFNKFVFVFFLFQHHHQPSRPIRRHTRLRTVRTVGEAKRKAIH